MQLSGRFIEVALLAALCFFLPLYEAPKSIAWLAYVVMWFINRTRARDFGGRWDGWDSLFAAWLASGFVVAAFSGQHANEWHGAVDLVRYGSVLWLLKRSRFTENELRWLIGALLVSALVATAMATTQIWIGSKRRLELNSVGHVNHTAIYLAITLGLAASWLFSGRRSWLAGTVAVALLAAVFATASRGALGAALIALVVLGVAWWRRSRLPLAYVSLAIAAIAVLPLFSRAELFEKQKTLSAGGDLLNFRGRLWGLALDAWQRRPWFGIGMDNFALVTRGEQEPYRTLFPHGHSLFVNTLVERGVIGALPLVAVLLAWIIVLVRYRPAVGDTSQAWTLWGGATAAWVVTVVAGTVNTTLHHEHGILAALLFGLWLSGRRL